MYYVTYNLFNLSIGHSMHVGSLIYGNPTIPEKPIPQFGDQGNLKQLSHVLGKERNWN